MTKILKLMLFLNVFSRRWASGRGAPVGEFRSASCFSLWRSFYRVYSCFWSLPKPIGNGNTVSYNWLCLLALRWNNAFFPCVFCLIGILRSNNIEMENSFVKQQSIFDAIRTSWWNNTLCTLSYWREFCMFVCLWNIIFNYVSYFLTIHNFIIPLLWRLRSSLLA